MRGDVASVSRKEAHLGTRVCTSCGGGTEFCLWLQEGPPTPLPGQAEGDGAPGARRQPPHDPGPAQQRQELHQGGLPRCPRPLGAWNASLTGLLGAFQTVVPRLVPDDVLEASVAIPVVARKTVEGAEPRGEFASASNSLAPALPPSRDKAVCTRCWNALEPECQMPERARIFNG